MKSLGFSVGQGLGKDNQGMVEPLESTGSNRHGQEEDKYKKKKRGEQRKKD